MYFIKKQRTRPLYKKLLPLRKNIQNNDKLRAFKRKKWQNLQRLILKLRKHRFYDPISQFLSNFKNFFNKKFKYNLQNKQRLSYYYGTLRRSYLKRTVKSTLGEFKKRDAHATVRFIEKLETRLDTALYRAYFAHSFNNARQLISHKKVYVNNKIVQHNSYLLKKGDIITLDMNTSKLVSFNLLGRKIWALPAKHFQINYKTLQILVLEDIKYTNCLNYYPFWVDFNSFLQFYRK
jgi:ribosomal protein S4